MTTILHRKTILIFFLLILSVISKAADEKIIASLSGSAIVINTSAAPSLLVADARVPYSTTTVFGIKSAADVVTLRYDESKRRADAQSWSLQVTYTINYYSLTNLSSVISSTGHTLTIGYDPTASYKDKDVAVFKPGYKATLFVTNISYQEGASSPVTTIPSYRDKDIYLDLAQETECYYNLNTGTLPIVKTAAVNGQKELPVKWNYLQGAESYDVEWLFIDIGSSSFSSSYNFDFRNATRINTSNQYYNIPLVYPRGILLYRVRAVGIRYNDPVFADRVEGNWSISNSSYTGATTSLTSVGGNEFRYDFSGLDPTYNWQYSAAFAEGGKRKEMVSYFDGSLRNRQTTTILNSDGNAVIAEPRYDYEGRPAAQVMPTPFANSGIMFYSSFNPNFDKSDFDLDANYNSPGALSLTSDNTGKFYSTNNTSQAGANSYIPNANGYGYSRTIFKQDGTNRVISQGGVGSTFAPGSGHETKYFYGTPTQVELDRLFGAEVGNYLHYKKNMVQDANQQVSISYLDQEGRVIATALAGDSPSNLMDIDMKPAAQSVSTDLLLGNNVSANDEAVSVNTLVVSSPGTYTFSYDLTADCYGETTPCVIACQDCKYDLYIEVKESESDVHPALTFTSSSPAVTGSPNPISMTDLAAGTYHYTASLSVGTYTIIKKLKINEENISSVIGPAMQTAYASCLTVPQVSAESCQTCQTVCEGTYTNGLDGSGNTIYIDDAGSVISEAAGLALIATCEQMCNNPLNSPAADPCLQHKLVMLQDMSPGGQYFDNRNYGNLFSPTTDINNWLNTNVHDTTGLSSWFTGSPFNYSGSVRMLTWDSVRAHWDESWATILMENYHPEYCAWQYYCDRSFCSGHTMAESNSYDLAMQNDQTGDYCNPTSFATSTTTTTPVVNWQLYNNRLGYTPSSPQADPYADASVAIHCDASGEPLSFPGCTPNSIARDDYMDALLSHYAVADTAGTLVYMSIWFVLDDPLGIHSYSTMAAAATGTGVPIPYHTMMLFWNLHGRGTTAGLLGTGSGQITKYEYFKHVYQGGKQLVLYTGLKNHCSGLPLLDGTTAPVNINYSSGGFQIRYPDNQSFDLFISNSCPTTFAGTSGLLSAFQSATSPSTSADLSTICTANCQGYANGWKTEIKTSCPSYTDAQVTEMVGYMVQVCAANCDGNNPQGTDGDPSGPSIAGPTGWGVSFKEFSDIFTAFSSHYGSCSPGIVHPPVAVTYTSANCTCENLHTFIDNLEISSPTNTDIADAFNEVFNPATAVTATDVAAWLTECNASSPSLTTLHSNNYPTSEDCPTDQYPTIADNCTVDGTQATADAAFTNDLNNTAAATEATIDFIAHYKDSCLSSLAGRETFTVSYDLNEYYYTLYYYDQAGNLIKTVPPDGVHLLTTTSLPTLATVIAYRAAPTGTIPTPAHSMVTHYKYNSLQQLVEQTTPDAGMTKFWYDNLGRLVASQNAKQSAGSKYSYTAYDALGRIYQVGEISPGSALTDAIAHSSSSFASWLTGTRSQITRTIYDQALSSTISGYFGSAGQENLRNRVSSTTYSEAPVSGAPSSDALTAYDYGTHFSYDIHGNVKTIIQEDPTLRDVNKQLWFDKKYIDYEYDLVSGNVNLVKYQSRRDSLGNPEPDRFFHRYYYDADNRITEVLTSHDSVIWEKDAKYFYYPHGPLARTEIGDKQVQATDYAYSLQGWVKGVNSNTLVANRDMGQDSQAQLTSYAKNNNANFGTDAMGYTLRYFSGDYSPINSSITSSNLFEASYNSGTDPYASLYNGNIPLMMNRFMNNDETYTSVQAMAYRYDQLNRIRTSTTNADANVVANNTMASPATTGVYNETFHYDFNGNITGVTRNGDIGGSLAMDDLTYNYIDGAGTSTYNTSMPVSATATNKLAYVKDNISSSTYTTDLDNQASSVNYQYDPIGNLIADASEEIDNIDWTVYGKIKNITRSTGSIKDELEFRYDPSGNRISKIVKPRTGGTPQNEDAWKYTYYVRDAQGNVMATYKRSFEGPSPYKDNYSLAELDIYGSSRLGIFDNTNGTIAIAPSTFTITGYSGNRFTGIARTQPSGSAACTGNCVYSYARTLGFKQYELSNHLGNVIATVSDRKLQKDVYTYTASAGTGGYVFDVGYNNYLYTTGTRTHVQSSGSDNIVDYYVPDVLSSNDYYPFGAPMPGRGIVGSTPYRYGFNGKEDDFEMKGDGNSYDFGERIYDPRLGKWLSVDKLYAKYPEDSPYSFAGNSPIYMFDKEGNTKIKCVNYIAADGTTSSITVTDADYVEKIASKDKYMYGFREAYDVFETVTIDFRNMKDGKPTTTTKTVYKLHSVKLYLDVIMNSRNKKPIITHALGDPAGNTDDPFGQFSGNTNPEVSPNANGGNNGEGNDDSEEGEKGNTKAEPNPNVRTDTVGFHVWRNKKTGDTVKVREANTETDAPKGSKLRKEFDSRIEKEKENK